MFAPAHRAARLRLDSHDETNEIPEIPSHALPKSYTLAQLYEDLLGGEEKPDPEDDTSKLLILHGCLKESQLVQYGGQDERYVTKLLSWISKAILPNKDVSTHDDAPDDNTNIVRQKAIQAARQRGAIGLKVLLDLFTLPDIQASHTTHSSEFFISILAFTSPCDTWNTPSSLATAQQLLSNPSIQSALQAPEFISNDVLQGFVRPLFSASKPNTVTSTGRKAMPSSAPLKRYDFNEERASKPWLYEKIYAITLLEWAVKEISTIALQTSWPLIVPPLLTLLDTPGTPILIRALPLITILLPKLPPKTLAQTGLASVFSEAIIPVTLYLPSITPLTESLEIMPLAYAALFTLCDVQFTPPPSTSSAPSNSASLAKSPVPSKSHITETNQDGKRRLAFLTSIIRQCILPAYLHASEHAPIVSVILTQLTTIIPKLGIHATKHLKEILPIISSVLTDPFAGARLSDVLVALETFRVLVLNCWVRFREELWRREGVRMLVLCWGAIGGLDGDDDDGKGGAQVDVEMLARVKADVRTMGKVFTKAVEGGDVNLKVELKPLFDVDEGIGKMFEL